MSLKIENNSKKLYLLNEFNLKGEFERNQYYLNSHIPICQTLKTDDYKIGNKFNIITRNENKIFQFNSNISFANTPLNYIQAISPESDSLIVNQRLKDFPFTHLNPHHSNG